MPADHSDFEILVVSHKYPPSTGGMQKQSYELIKNLQSFTIVHKIIFSGKYPKALFFLLVVPWCLVKVWRHPQIRVIHANDGLMALFITPMLWLSSKKLAATVHGLDIIFKSSFYQFWVRKFLSKFSWVIAVSAETREECLKAGIPAEKAHYIPNGFELMTGFKKNDAVFDSLAKRFNLKVDGCSIIVSIGRPIKRKGFVWFAKNILPQLNSPVVYMIVGPREANLSFILWLSKVLPTSFFLKISHLFGFGLEALELDRLMTDLSLAGKLIFTGKLPQNELDQLLLHADLLAMPNLKVDGDYEGFGLVALEAASHGLVCVAARVDGVPSAVKDNQNGILLTSGDAGEWSNKINKLLANKQKLMQLGEKYKMHVEENMFNWYDMTEAYYELFTGDKA